jgi:hypothetical protein
VVTINIPLIHTSHLDRGVVKGGNNRSLFELAKHDFRKNFLAFYKLILLTMLYSIIVLMPNSLANI